MIGVQYQSDQRIVDIYKDVKTLAENHESKIPQEDVLNYIELISVNKKCLINIKPVRLKKF